MMMQPDNFPPSWPFDTTYIMNSTIDDHEFHFDGRDELSSSFTATDQGCSEISSISHFFSSENNFSYIPACDDQQLQVTVPIIFHDFSVDSNSLEGFESMVTDHVIEDLYNCLDESSDEGTTFPSQPSSSASQRQDEWSPSPSIKSSEASIDMASMQSSMDSIDNQSIIIFHLLKAYGEAIEKNQRELADVILRCVGEKASPVGETWERIAFNLCGDIQNQADYLMQESSKNFEAAFTAFYQMFPFGRFAHFAANSALLEAMPNDADTLHIVDFDMREGIQWPPMIEAMAWQHKNLRLTSIRWEDDDQRLFEETRRQLCNHAKSFGLKLKVEEVGLEDLMNELKRMKKQEWLAFNCMVGLPHMGKVRSRMLVNEFLNIAREQLARCGNRGIITLGDGEACSKLNDWSGFSSFFDGHLLHYQAVLESMEANFSKQLVQARMAMECLFVWPNICSQAWVKKWKEIVRNEASHFEAEPTLEGLRVRAERLMEAKAIVRENESSYEVKIGGNCGNELALEWRGTTLVRVSSWRN